MPILEEKLRHIEGQVQLLLRKHEALQKSYDSLITTNNITQENLKSATEHLEKLQAENLLHKSALQALSDEEKKELEKKLNKYIKTIEQSIAVISR